MKKVGVLIDNGFEVIDMLLVVDIMRRAEFQCDIISTHSNLVSGVNKVVVKADFIMDSVDINLYDMLIIPSGASNVEKLISNESVINSLNNVIKQKKWLGLIGDSILLTNVIQGTDKELSSDSIGLETYVIKDNLILCKGFASTYAFAYECLELLGVDSESIKQRMVYYNAFDAKKVK